MQQNAQVHQPRHRQVIQPSDHPLSNPDQRFPLFEPDYTVQTGLVLPDMRFLRAVQQLLDIRLVIAPSFALLRPSLLRLYAQRAQDERLPCLEVRFPQFERCWENRQRSLVNADQMLQALSGLMGG
jgi:hypothetical protein